jgi:ABC-type glycerol-3-phosphate transport system substrate-binding protein
MPGFIARSLRLCSLFVVVALILAACGAPTATTPGASPAGTTAAEPSTAASPAGSPDAAASPATAETATGGSTSSGQTIKVTTTNAPDENNPSDIARHQQLLAEFKKVRPEVEVEAHQGGFDKEAFTAKFAAGTMEDSYLVPFTEPQEMIARGQAADITDIIKGWQSFGSFNPEVLKIVQGSDGKIYGVPVGGYALGLIYNRKLFQEAGLDPNKPPTTWDEVREYAKKLTDPAKGRAGFAELSKGNQGGWHFTAWKYSFGGDLVQQKDGKWTATFNDENGVKALQTLKDMRWTDKSMTEQQLLTVGDVLPLLANEQVAMAVMAPDALRDMKTKFQAKIEDFGMAPLPQGGGNGTLAGGAAWLFNPKSAPEVIKAAFDWTVNRDFSLSAFEADLKGRQERADLVGFPELPLFTGEFEQQRQAIVAKYANAPVENYRPYMESKLQLRTEPPVKTQEMYAVLDTAMQAVLTDQNADPKQALDEAAQQFQTQVLDQIK